MIYEIEWKNHPVLNNLKLDLSSGDRGYSTIVLAGENGTGKTSILNDLATFLSLHSFNFEKLKYSANGKFFELLSDEQIGRMYGFHYRIDSENRLVEPKQIRTNKNNDRQIIEQDLDDVRHYGCAYSRAKSGFATRPVTSSLTSQLNQNKYDVDMNEDYTSIKQLLVDLDAQDSADFKQKIMDYHFEKGEDAEIFKQNFIKSSKMNRFQRAFDSFFDDLKFSRIDNNDSKEKRVLFKKNNAEIPVDSLSTGEKQIVFRGASLLKNASNIQNGVVLIDEPELSMHPKWQRKILKFYRDLFSNESGQFAQIFIATHSDYVVKSAFEEKNEIVVISLVKNNSGVVEAKKVSNSPILPTISFSEINYKTFGVYSSDFHNALYGHLQETAILENPDNCRESSFDSWLVGKGCVQSKMWIALKNGCVQPARPATLQTYIRNKIHHPENTLNNDYSEDELKLSIEKMIEIVGTLRC